MEERKTTATLTGALPADFRYDRWVVYLSRDRRVLWYDAGDADRMFPNDALQAQAALSGDACPAGAVRWNRLLDLAQETRLPQYGTETLSVNGTENRYTVKVFPDLSVDGKLKGLIQVVEKVREGVEWDTDLKKTVNALLDLTLSGVILYSPSDDRIININRRIAQQTGYAVNTLQDMPGKILFGDSGAAMLKGIFARMLTAGDSMVWGQDLAITDNYGETRRYLCSLRAIPERPSPDSPMAMFITLDASTPPSGDIPSGPNVAFLINAFRDGLWEYELRSNAFFYGRTFAELYGPEGLEGGPGKKKEDWLQSVHPEDREKIRKRYRGLLKKGERYCVQYRYRDPHGDWRWISSTIHAVLNDAQGRPARIIGFHMEITDTVKTDMRLVDAEEQLRLIIENVGIGIAVAGMDGALSRVNPTLSIMLGRDRSELVGTRLSECAHPEDRDTVRGVLTRIVRSGRRETLQEQRFVRPDGSVLWITLTATLSTKAFEGERYVILIAEDVTERHERQERLQYEATHDVMTGSWSRWVLMERLEQHINLAKRHNQSMAFCICDLDHFKSVNDTRGHQTGDQVLIRFVEIVKRTLRDTEVVGRYGGEEFGIVFPNTSVKGAAGAMERIRRHFSEQSFVDSRGNAFRVTASFGVAGVSRDSTMKSVIAQADALLYEAKKAGRNRVVVGDPTSGDKRS